MFYTEYKEAAERHLEVCFQLEKLLIHYQKVENGRTLTNKEAKEKLQLLSDLYYLSGYIIECSYNYAIYKHISYPNTEPVKNLKPANWAIYGISVNNMNVSYRSITNGGNSSTFLICRPDHKLDCSMHFFASSTHGGNLALPIPLLDGNNVARPCTDLFQNWGAEIRYTIDSSLNLDYDNVFDFLYLALEIIEGLKTNSMI